MSQVKTIVKNDSTKSLQLKTCNGGVYRKLKILPVGEELTINCNTIATLREWQACVRPDSTQSQANSAQPDVVNFTSDDCMEYAEIHIQDTEDNPPRLKVSCQSPRYPDATILSNRTKGDVKFKITEKTRGNPPTHEEVLQPEQRVAIFVGTKHDCREQSVNKEGGATLLIPNKAAARSKAVNILDAPGEASELKLEMEGTRETKTGLWSKVKGWFAWFA